MTRTNRLEGRTAVVSGAGSGIGREIALLFAAEGARVVCMDVVASTAEETAQAARAHGTEAWSKPADISLPVEVSAARDWILSRCGEVDILVNNAGTGSVGSVADLSVDRWRASLETNLSGAFYMSKAFWPGFMKQHHGVIVNNSSIMGLTGDMNSVAYCSAKAALIGLTKCLAADGAAHGIRANCICPGFVDTPAMRAVAGESKGDGSYVQFERQIPLGRMANTREVANAFLFLASDESSYITGTTLIVDGGATLGYQGSDISSTRWA